jgi:hypothetical protein
VARWVAGPGCSVPGKRDEDRNPPPPHNPLTLLAFSRGPARWCGITLLTRTISLLIQRAERQKKRPA